MSTSANGRLARPAMPPRSHSDFNHDPVLSTNPKVLPSGNYRSPYYMPFNNSNEPRPVDLMIHRFSIWKMIIKQLVFYFKELSIFKRQTYLANKAMLENLDILKKQNSGKLNKKSSSSNTTKNALKATMSSVDLSQLAGTPNSNTSHDQFINSFMRSSFLPEQDHSVLSISSTLFNYHAGLAEKELITYNQLTLKIIPRLENLKENLNDAIKQMASLKNSSEFKIKDLKIEIAKTGALLADYMASVELLTKGEAKTSLGTDIKFNNKMDPKDDPYLLRLKLDLQLKDQLYTEAHLKEAYFDLQHKSVQLETILYKEVQDCTRTFVNLINSELDAGKNNLVADMMNGLLKNEYGIDWDYFINNDNAKNLLKVSAQESLVKEKQIRKKSDVIYPYQRDRISAPLISGFLEKRSKYLKTYSRFYYVLSFNYMHEFRTDDRKKEPTPISSYRLDDIVVFESSEDSKKFIMRVHPKSSSEKAKYTFRCFNEDTASRWLDLLSELTSYSDPLQRNDPSNVLETVTPIPFSAISPKVSSSTLDHQQHPPLTVADDSATLNSVVSYESLLSEENAGSTSSLHLPTFQSVKVLQSGEPPSPGHRSIKSTSSIPGRLYSPYSESSSSPDSTPKGRVVSPLSGEGDDYFNYVAPRPKISPQNSYTSSANTATRVRASPSISVRPSTPPSAASNSRLQARAVSPVRKMNSETNLIQSALTDKTLPTIPYKGRERLRAQLMKANSQSTSMSSIIKQQQSLNGTMLTAQQAQNLPQTPGELPMNSVGDLFISVDESSADESSVVTAEGAGVVPVPRSAPSATLS